MTSKVTNRRTKKGVSISSIFEEVGKESNNAILKNSVELDKIYWKQWMPLLVKDFKTDYPDSWQAVLSKNNGNIENATKEVYDNVKLNTLKTYGEKFNEVVRRNKLRIEKTKATEQSTLAKYKSFDFRDQDFSKHMANILTDTDFAKYNKKVSESYKTDLPMIKPSKSNPEQDPLIYFIITEEPEYWLTRIEEYDLKMEPLHRCYNSFKSVSELKEFAIRLGFNQTFDNNEYTYQERKFMKHIAFIYYNDVFRVSTYFKTFAYLKNKLDKMSMHCINYKNLLYLNIEKYFPNEISNFMARSIIIDNTTKSEKLNRDFLRRNIMDKYTKTGFIFDTAINEREKYIARPVEYKEDIRYSASLGSDIYILNFENDDDMLKENLEKISKLLETTYHSFIISKYINTKKLNNRFFHIRSNVNGSLTILPELGTLKPDYTTKKYCMKAFIPKKNLILMKSNESTDDSIKSYSNMNTHAIGEYRVFPDDIPTSIISPELYNNYMEQMANIVLKVFTVLKNEVQLYPDCESAFQEFGFDFMIGNNDQVYLAEVNIDGWFYNFQDKQSILQHKYMLLNNQESIILGILTPLFLTGEYHTNSKEYDSFLQVNISDDVENEPSRKRKPIKAKSMQRGPLTRKNTLTYMTRLSQKQSTMN